MGFFIIILGTYTIFGNSKTCRQTDMHKHAHTHARARAHTHRMMQWAAILRNMRV